MNKKITTILKYSIISVFFLNNVASIASAQSKKKTVGELLSQAAESSRGGNAISNRQKSFTEVISSDYQFSNKSVNLDSVKPPKSSTFMKSDASGATADYEKILDQQIQQLYNLTEKFKGSSNRGELWLRLAELYVEKSTLVDQRIQDDYDRRLQAFQSGKIKNRPSLNLESAREFNRKAVQLYEWFQRDFPRDPKMSQALFFLGFNYFELGEVEKGAKYYQRLNAEYPSNPFVGEAHFALGEYHFENEQWANAYREYSYILKNKNHRLHTFSMYKGAWCLYRLGKYKQALKYLETIIKSGQETDSGSLANKKVVNKTKLEAEASRDLVMFYAEAGSAEVASNYFKRLLGGDVSAQLERLAYYYADKGNKEASRDVFAALIAERPTHPKAFEFQYQIVQNFYYAKNTGRFKDELMKLVRDYGPKSAWVQANQNNSDLIENSLKLRETTLRTYILQQHQTAQNSRAVYSQNNAYEGYQLYIKDFSESPMIPEMTFYFGELLYDMGKFDEAAQKYKWVVDNAPQSKFGDKAAQNLMIAIEKSIPSDEELSKRVGNSVDPIPMDPKIERFIESSKWYLRTYPKSEKAVEVKFRTGRLYYQHNRFDEAASTFKDIVKNHNKTKYAEYSANLLLDIYNLKKDYGSLAKVGAELLADPGFANTKAAEEVRGVIEKASFKAGQDLELEKKYGASASTFEEFATQNPKSNLATTALFNAAVNYERAGQNTKAISIHRQVLSSKSSGSESLKSKSRRLLAKLYQNSGQFEESANLYMQCAAEDSKDPLVSNYLFNAGILYDALGKRQQAVSAYEKYLQGAKNSSERGEATWLLAGAYQKQGVKSKAADYYKQYLDANLSNGDRVLEAMYRIYEGGTARSEKDEYRSKIISTYKRIQTKEKVSTKFVALAALDLAKSTYQELKSIEYSQDPKKQQAEAAKKLDLIVRINNEVGEVIKLDSAEEIIAGLALMGDANLNMVDSLEKTPTPKGLTEDETKFFKENIQKVAEPFRVRSTEFYKKAVDRGLELQVYSDDFHRAYRYMNSKDPANYYDGGELGQETRFVNWMVK